MNDLNFLQIQTIELQRLLEESGSNPILAPQLEDRLKEAQNKLEEARRQPGIIFPKESPNLPRAAIFMRGDSIKDTFGIRPSLAGEALIQYEKMFIEQALHDEREAARNAGRQRRPRGAVNPGLWFTGTPRGSFGLEFVPQVGEDDLLLEVHAKSLENIADSLSQVVNSEAAAFDDVLNKIPPRVLQPLKKFLGILAQYGAELRLAFPDRPSRSLSLASVKKAAESLERDVIQEPITLEGTFRGVTRESGVFDFRIGETVITGIVADSLTEEDIERIDKLTNHLCVAELEKTTVRKIGGVEFSSYILIDAHKSKSRKESE